MPETSASLRGQHLHIDGASGAAGDMVLGALIHLGVPRALFDEAFDRIGLGRERLSVESVVKHGLAAVNVTIDAHQHGHDHVRHADIADRLRGAGLDPAVLARALDIFQRLAEAEATLHGVPVDEVEFHEVGAIDSIADVVGAAVGLDYLAPASVTASAIALGHGAVKTAHGLLPVPAPAALEILRRAGAAVTDGGAARELCTPTGAAILAHAVGAWTAMPPLQPLAVGHGAGDADLPDRPNVLRFVVGRPLGEAHRVIPFDLVTGSGGDLSGGTAEHPEDEAIYRVEANIDDMSPELCEHAAEVIAMAGALDVWWTPVAMKKSRPALLLTALAPPAALEPVLAAVLAETTSIGVRFDRVARRVLARELVTVDTPFGPIPVKVARQGEHAVNAAPEYEACRAAARAHRVPLKSVFAAAVAAWQARR
ncbi:MAG TPA: nickel pincer cofactor biosynthesis protein LarC [Kofleriaceae bacterium]|jgi:hypothetical protein